MIKRYEQVISNYSMNPSSVNIDKSMLVTNPVNSN